ncbi:MAG: adenosine deaminase [Acidimicrobiales bacterium]|nr:adenosine deaminase [Acidimicrobiales bacterium]
MRDLRALPKGHLHLHLELAMRPSTLADLAAKYGMEVPVIRGYGNFTAFSATCQATMATLRDRSDWERLADEICADAVADGAVYIEPSFWAGQYVDIWGSLAATWDLVLDVFDKAAATHGITVRFMAAVDRVLDSPDEAMAIALLAVELQDRGVVSFGLHNDEVGHPPQDFVDCFRVAKAGELLITPHAGELEHGQFVKDSVDLLAADRIQHGVRAFEVPGLVEQLAEQGICLDVCPTSNIMLSVFPSLAEHPLPQLLEAGVKVTINADDPLLFGPGLLDEYELCRRELGLTDEQLAFAARCSLECGGAPDDLKAEALAGIDSWLATPA